MWVGLGVIYQRLFNFQDYTASKFIVTVNDEFAKAVEENGESLFEV